MPNSSPLWMRFATSDFLTSGLGEASHSGFLKPIQNAWNALRLYSPVARGSWFQS